MTILITSDDGNTDKVEPSHFDNEAYLQNYIHNNPESLPLYDIKEDIELLILAREYSTNSGPIDALAIDREGSIYIVETKLYQNADKRRVIAQALDYGAALWKYGSNFTNFVNSLSAHTNKTWKLALSEKLQEFFNLNTDEVTYLLDNVRSNLDDGIFEIVILMDKLDERLKDTILYVNENSQFSIYAVEFKYYKTVTQEIVIPKLYGAEVKKSINVAPSKSGARKKWNEASFFEALEQQTSNETQKAVEELYNHYKSNSDGIDWGTGASRGSFTPRFKDITERSLFSVFSDGEIRINIQYVDDNSAAQRALIEKVSELPGIDMPADFEGSSYAIEPEIWLPLKRDFINIISDLKANYQK